MDSGVISLTTLTRASRVLNTKTISEKRSLLLELENKSSREVDKILSREMSTIYTSLGPTNRCVINSDNIKVTLEFTAEEFKNLERLKALKSHQAKDIKELVSLLVDKELEKYNRTSQGGRRWWQ